MAATNQKPELLKVEASTIINLANVTYIELTGGGGIDIHFVGKNKPLHLKANQGNPLRHWVSGDDAVTDLTKSSARPAHRQAASHS
jgi:hypothetical protein